MTLRGRGGLVEMVEMLVPLPLWMTALAAGVCAFAVMWGLLLLSRRCDRDGDTIAAVRWSLSSRSLNAVVLVALAVVPVAMMGSVDAVAAWLGDADSGLSRFFLHWWWLILPAIVAVPALLAPFCLINPHTLSRERLEAWWRPFWPGAFAVLIGLAGGIAAQVLAIVPEDGGIVGTGAWRWLLLMASQSVLLSAAQLAALVLWLNRSRWWMAGAALLRGFRRDVLRRWVALELFWSAMAAVVVVPVLGLTAFDVYFAPQFAEWARSGTVGIPPALRALMAITDSGLLHEGIFIAAAYALGVYGFISAGRLLVGLGIGRPVVDGAAGP